MASKEVIPECCNCGKELEGEEAENPYMNDDDIYCDDCFTREFQETCAICEDYFDKPTSPEEHYFCVDKKSAKYHQINPGIYRVLRYPFYRVSCLGDDFSLFHEDVEFVAKFSCKDSGNVCPDCFKKYTNQNVQ